MFFTHPTFEGEDSGSDDSDASRCAFWGRDSGC
jgi:hypothetical protein